MEQHSKERIIPIEIYTDGSCKKIGKYLTFGGWAFIVIQDGKIIYKEAGGVTNTTNQRMELQAVIEALKYAYSIRRNVEKVIIYSDSAYIINCYNQEWYTNWLNNNWFTSTNKPVSNRDLWEQIIPFFDNFWYTFKKIPGHAGVLWNEVCDEMAQQVADEAKRGYKG